MARDLRFHACVNDRPEWLSQADVAHFNEHGHLKGLRIFDEAGASANRQYFDALLARVLASGGDSYSISSAHLKERNMA